MSQKSLAYTTSGRSQGTFSNDSLTRRESSMQRQKSIKQFNKQSQVMQRAEVMRVKKAEHRNSQLKRIERESRQTLMKYAKTSNVLEQFAQNLKEQTREEPDSDDEVNMQMSRDSSYGSKSNGGVNNHLISHYSGGGTLSDSRSPPPAQARNVQLSRTLQSNSDMQSIQHMLSPIAKKEPSAT